MSETTKGTIFEIHSFSLHDGPGIRTTVFLKGCSLRCHWCSNPESFSFKPSLSYSINKCHQCLKCTEVCPTYALTIENNRLHVNYDCCNGCSACIDECPNNALRIYGYKEDASSIIAQVLKDKAYFDKSGGGITLSGGEVLMQTSFAIEILEKAKHHGLHTCIETCGYGKEADLKSLLPYVDLFLFDYKATGNKLHETLTGHDQQIILHNLNFLTQNNANIHLRCPIIPGINDTDKHLKGIAEISNASNAILEVEIMPYHHYGLHKYKQLGLKTPNLPEKAASEELVQSWYKKLKVLGCHKLNTSAPN